MKKEIRRISNDEMNNFIDPVDLIDSIENLIDNSEYRFTKSIVYETDDTSYVGEEFDYDKLLDHIIFYYLPRYKKVNVTEDSEKYVSVTFESLLELNLSKPEFKVVLNILSKLGIKIEYNIQDLSKMEDAKKCPVEDDEYKKIFATLPEYDPDFDTKTKIIEYQKEENKEKKREILNEIVSNHSRFVLFFMYQVMKLSKNYSAEDALQEGLIGLSKSVDAYDVTKNVNFTSYASYRIYSAINKFKSKSFSNINGHQGSFNRTVYGYIQEACKKYDYDFNKALTNGLFDSVYELMIKDGKRVTPKKLQNAFDDIASIINLVGGVEFKNLEDQEVSEDIVLTPVDFVEEYEDEILDIDFKAKIREVLRSDYLSKLEKAMIIERFFYKGKTQPSFKELAKKYNVGVDRVTFNEIKGICKLRRNPEIERLRKY